LYYFNYSDVNGSSTLIAAFDLESFFVLSYILGFGFPFALLKTFL